MLSKRLRPTALTFLLLAIVAAVAARSNVRRWIVGWPSDTERRLQGHLTKVQFDNVPFDAALERFSRATGLAFDAKWTTLESEGILRTTKVRLRLENVTVATALDELLRAGFQRRSPPSYDLLPDGRVMIGSTKDLGRCVVTRLYDLRDLVDGDLRFYNGIPVEASVEDAMLRWAAARSAAPPAVPPPTNMQIAPAPVGLGYGNLPQYWDGAHNAPEVMDQYAEFIARELETNVGDDGQPPVGVRAAGRYLVVTARPAVQAKAAELIAAFHGASEKSGTTSRPEEARAPQDGVQEAPTRGGTRLFGR
jgi:hypothetical protein